MGRSSTNSLSLGHWPHGKSRLADLRYNIGADLSVNQVQGNQFDE